MVDGGLSGCTSLLPTEFDAIAVLNQMSCSNVPFDHEPMKRVETNFDSGSAGKTLNKRKGSLFSQVVGEDGASKKMKSK